MKPTESKDLGSQLPYSQSSCNGTRVATIHTRVNDPAKNNFKITITDVHGAMNSVDNERETKTSTIHKPRNGNDTNSSPRVVEDDDVEWNSQDIVEPTETETETDGEPLLALDISDDTESIGEKRFSPGKSPAPSPPSLEVAHNIAKSFSMAMKAEERKASNGEMDNRKHVNGHSFPTATYSHSHQINAVANTNPTKHDDDILSIKDMTANNNDIHFNPTTTTTNNNNNNNNSNHQHHNNTGHENNSNGDSIPNLGKMYKSLDSAFINTSVSVDADSKNEQRLSGSLSLANETSTNALSK
ncbi:hypothetical protein RFI_23102, partial [Reticulomyxa filosa]